MLWLFFLHLVIHHSSYNEAQIEKAACKSQVGLVSLQERFCSTVEAQIDGHLESTKRPSLQGREVPRTSWSSNPNYVGLQGFLEVQGLQKSCEGDCGILCSLWKTLEWSLGPEYSDSNMKVHGVWPQPQGDTPGFHIIVEFLLGDELPHPSIEPALEESTILSIHGRPDVQRTALYHQRRLHNVDITRPFYDVCHRAQYVCVTRVLGKILPLSWARNIFAGALVQLFAHPPSLQITQEYADYFDRMQPFFADSLAMWAEVHLPTISWQFHLLLPEGYRGVMETTASINSATSVAMVADRAFAHWGMDLPGALVYAGLSSHVSTTQHFIAYDPVEGGIPCLVQAEIDDSLGIPAPPMIAVSLSSTCTIQEVIAAINAVWIFDLVGVEITVFDGTLVFDSEDRFRPRHGTSYVVQVRPRAHDEVSTLQILQSMKHASNLRDPRPSRAPDVASGSGGIPQEHTPIPGPTEPEPEGASE